MPAARLQRVRYLATLLAAAGEELHVGELAGLGDAEPPRALVDRRVRRAFRERAGVLREAIEEAERRNDGGRALRAREELDVLAAEIAAAYRLEARTRASDDPIERARKAVGNRIRADLLRLQPIHVELWEHLSRAIRTGTFCSYRPERPVDWELDRIPPGPRRLQQGPGEKCGSALTVPGTIGRAP